MGLLSVECNLVFFTASVLLSRLLCQLGVCMVFSILLISTGTQEKFKNTQRNKAQIGILGVTDEQTAQLRQNENIMWVGEYSALGLFYVENKTITVAYGNEDYFLHQEEKTFHCFASFHKYL